MVGGAGADTLSGGSGTDVADYSGSAAVSAYADTVAGDGGANTFGGGAGADRIAGGAGLDTVDYTGSIAAVTVDLGSGNGLGGYVHGDMLSGIERVIGSGFGDVLTGAAGVDVLEGGGWDRLVGSAGADMLAGGGGIDTADYAGSISGVGVHLATGSGIGGYAYLDTIAGFENLVGSAHADTLVGSGGANRLEGGAGDDVLNGAAGDDVLAGGFGDDVFVFGNVTGNDTILDFVTGAGSYDAIDLSYNAALNGFADVQAHATQVGADTLIDLGGGQQLTLAGVTAATLHQDDFLF